MNFLIIFILFISFCSKSNNLTDKDPDKIKTSENFENEEYNYPELDAENGQSNSDRSIKVWDHWGEWSPCSVSCGTGKMTRWRHCVSGACATGEKLAQIKTCTNSAC